MLTLLSQFLAKGTHSMSQFRVEESTIIDAQP
jgi:hypothetical protein